MAARRIPDPKVGGSNPSGLMVFFLFLHFMYSYLAETPLQESACVV